MDNKINELSALNNALNHYNFNGYKIHEYQQQDKRKTKPLYFLTDNKGTSITGTLDYSELNNFIRGYGKACNKYDSLLEALKRIADCENEINIVTSSDAKGFIRIAKEAIKKASQ